MALILSTAARDAACNATVDLVDGGAGANGTLELLDSPTVSATIALNATAFGAAATGVATAAGFPKSAVVATGVTALDVFIVKNKAGTEVWRGTITATGGGGDLTIDNVLTATGQTLTLSSFTHTQPAT